ncbi:MAG: protein-L-isoaspartate(D-aspartate) O-methyltransferase [Caldilineaceae bacterium]|nr:protein-L-isoaspartate(D-aspartate) O-methyltransferase [Caldilineaceae bacterium]MBP8109886.1 protein-L-isoaspartate(D-aspartate) O-methyltransferase [Caldilineaceae bacterium]MBP8123480.1 protein-L-isoaspartate(D-aspartate) O-methyltransferase [Caldilineaceae bacterium]MBP9074867.1 protein-L-isoaspartate(D-aspartate) O-methyltransferase [Caldilineaceae bacterium]
MRKPKPSPNASWPPPWPEITDQRVLAAVGRVDRAAFVPAHLRPWAKADIPLAIGQEQTISQPFVVALMTQALDLLPGQRVLEIGTGSGYQTALLCELVKTATGGLGETVFSVERFPALAKRAETVLKSLGYAPHLRVGDGAGGWSDMAPFEAIIVTAAPVALPAALFTQLAEGGRMVIPIGPRDDAQTLWLVRKQDGAPKAQALCGVRFVPLVSPLLDDPDQRLAVSR